MHCNLNLPLLVALAMTSLTGCAVMPYKDTAVRTSPVIMETVILPYQTWFGTLAGERTLWVPVEDAKWVWPDQFDAKAHSEIGSITK